MNLFADIRALVVAELEGMMASGDLPGGLDLGAVAVEPPRDAGHGEMATNAAMVLAKPAGMQPRAIADALALRLMADPRVAGADVAGPGFLNLRLEPLAWQGLVRDVLVQGAGYGRSSLGAGRRVNVEFVSANPTGPMHVAHARGAVVGDALAALLDFAGYAVTREYYINDGGAQVDVLARSAYERYREANGLSPEIAEGLYPGDYLIPVGQELKERYGDSLIGKPESDWLADVREFATARMMEMIREDLALLDVHMDVFTSEKAIAASGEVEKAIAALREMGLIYEGTLEPPKGELPDDWEPRRQTLFRSTAHGDDVDRPVQKSDGSWTYFAPDIAYHRNKVTRGFDLLIDVLGADHHGYVARVRGGLEAMGEPGDCLEVCLIQFVSLFRGEEKIPMGKRDGQFVTLRQLREEVGNDACRLFYLMRSHDQPLDFDLELAKSRSNDNPVYYIQYAHARIASVFRQLADRGLAHDIVAGRASLGLLAEPHERALMSSISKWPELVESAAAQRGPHLLVHYLRDLANDFHSYYNALPFLVDDAALRDARLTLLVATRQVLLNGLKLLGVSAPDIM